MRRAAFLAALSLLLLTSSGCGADETVPLQAGLRAPVGPPAPGAGDVLDRFVAAAGRGDAVEMWGLLSAPTQASLGPSLDRFRWSAARDLQRAAGRFVGEPERVLAQAVGTEWAVAAVAGEVEDDDGEREPAAFAAALRREDGRWRLELDGIFFVGHAPHPLAEVDDDEPDLEAFAQSSARIERMVLWLGGEPVGARVTRPMPFTGAIAARAASPLSPGVHVLTVFAATEDTAAAQAWPFEVER